MTGIKVPERSLIVRQPDQPNAYCAEAKLMGSKKAGCIFLNHNIWSALICIHQYDVVYFRNHDYLFDH